MLHVFDVVRTVRRGLVLTHAIVLVGLVTIQAALGILTLVHQVPIGLALAHQAGAILVLALATMHAQSLTTRSAAQSLGVPVKA